MQTRIGRARRTSWTRKLSGAVTLSMLAAVTLVVAGPSASADTIINGCTIVSAPTSTTHTVCPGVDLSGVDLSHLDLDFADLDHANLQDANAAGGIWHAAVTSSTPTSRAADAATSFLCSMDAAARRSCRTTMTAEGVLDGDFTDADLDHLDLFSLEAGGALTGTFDGANLEGMSYANELHGSFRGCRPTRRNRRRGFFGGLGIFGSDFTGAVLTGMGLGQIIASNDFTDANLTDTTFEDAQFSNNTYTGSTWTGSTSCRRPRRSSPLMASARR